MGNDIKAMLEASIKAKVLEALSSSSDVITNLVDAALKEKVYSNGSTESRNSWGEDKRPFMDWLIGDRIRRATEQAVSVVMQEQMPMITEHVRSKLNAESIVAAFAGSILKTVEEDWRIRVSFETEKDRR